MKKIILVVVLCVACCIAGSAQTKKKGVRKPTPKTQKRVANSNTTGTSAKPLIDTTKKVAATLVPIKPFDRPLDGYYKKNNIISARVTPYATLRESDVALSKRIWREIDVRDKLNQFMASPKLRLIDIIMTAVADGELTAYDAIPSKNDADGDGFSVPLTPAQAKNKMADSSIVEHYDKDGNKTKSELRAGEFSPDSVVRFRIKEDWYFDRQRSVWEPRIIGIAPMVKLKAAPGVELDYQPAFWIYFPEARHIFAVKEAVNRQNDNTGLSYDDIFMKRIFYSYIVKQSNDKDERIKDYAIGIDRLYESDRIKKQMMDWELGLWQY
jgi:gliding motility associated protien GldN